MPENTKSQKTQTYSRDQDVRLLEDALAAGKDVCARVSEGPYSNEWLDALAALDRIVAGSRSLEEQYQAALDALREASLHQGLPEDAPPDRIAAHFRGNREFAGGFRKIAEESSPATKFLCDMTHPGEPCPASVPNSGGLASGAEVLGDTALEPPQSQTTDGYVPAVVSNQEREPSDA